METALRISRVLALVLAAGGLATALAACVALQGTSSVSDQLSYFATGAIGGTMCLLLGVVFTAIVALARRGHVLRAIAETVEGLDAAEREALKRGIAETLPAK